MVSITRNRNIEFGNILRICVHGPFGFWLAVTVEDITPASPSIYYTTRIPVGFWYMKSCRISIINSRTSTLASRVFRIVGYSLTLRGGSEVSRGELVWR